MQTTTVTALNIGSINTIGSCKERLSYHSFFEVRVGYRLGCYN